MPDVAELIDRHWPLDTHSGIARQLFRLYDAPGRWYHDARHLAEVLDRVDVLLDQDNAPDPDAILVAAWFHDAVYDPAGDNEERSAALAERVLGPTPLSRSTLGEVARLVRLTATHDPDERDTAGAILCDADLAILAADEPRYGEYVTGVRREYAHVAHEDFVRGRAAVLRRLVDRAHLFHTSYARAHWEEPARRNVAAELSRLEGDRP